MNRIFRYTFVMSFSMLICFFSATGLMADEQVTNVEYRVSEGDKLRITIYGHEDLSGEFEIDAAGNVSLPLAGDIRATGGTANDLEAAIIDALQPDYLKNPRVSVELLDYRPFYIVGEVQSPGRYPFAGGMTVISAVAVAGGFTYRARKNRIRILRDKDNNQVELKADDDTLVQPGDVIEVPERFF
jgi:protein involved in polysaccharide export with SLBB domain